MSSSHSRKNPHAPTRTAIGCDTREWDLRGKLGPPGVNIAPAWEIGSAHDKKRHRDVLGMPGRGGLTSQKRAPSPFGFWKAAWSCWSAWQVDDFRTRSLYLSPAQCVCACVSVNVCMHTRTHLSLADARPSVLPLSKSLEAGVWLRDVNARGVYSLPPRKLRGCDARGSAALFTVQ